MRGRWPDPSLILTPTPRPSPNSDSNPTPDPKPKPTPKPNQDDGGSKSVRGVGVDNAQTDVNIKLVPPSADFFFKLGREPPGRALVHKGFQDAYAHLSGPVAEWLKSRGAVAGAKLRI